MPSWMKTKAVMPTREDALADNHQAIAVPAHHEVLGSPMTPPFPDGMRQVLFGLGCFWGAERLFWQLPGVFTTAVGYAGGFTAHATYQQVCSGRTGHNEVVLVVYDPAKISFEVLLQTFWQGHDPTQGLRQGNDVGSQYRSGIYTESTEQLESARRSKDVYQRQLDIGGYGAITTEIIEAPPFYYAEAYHQQYLEKNPGGYCGLGGTGITCPMGLVATAAE